MSRMFRYASAQGDLYIRRIEGELPSESLTLHEASDKIVVTHSETGHDHVIELDPTEKVPAAVMYNTDNPLISWLKINRPVSLYHHRSFDQHEALVFEPGNFEIRRQREYTPEGYRQVQD